MFVGHRPFVIGHQHSDPAPTKQSQRLSLSRGATLARFRAGRIRKPRKCRAARHLLEESRVSNPSRRATARTGPLGETNPTAFPVARRDTCPVSRGKDSQASQVSRGATPFGRVASPQSVAPRDSANRPLGETKPVAFPVARRDTCPVSRGKDSQASQVSRGATPFGRVASPQSVAPRDSANQPPWRNEPNGFPCRAARHLPGFAREGFASLGKCRAARHLLEESRVPNPSRRATARTSPLGETKPTAFLSRGATLARFRADRICNPQKCRAARHLLEESRDPDPSRRATP